MTFPSLCMRSLSMRWSVPPLKWAVVTALLAILAAGCASQPRDPLPARSVAAKKSLPPLRYAIQVGAFSNLNNAVRLTQNLQDRGLNAYYFICMTGLYKVRFGNFPSNENARKKAEGLRATGLIEEYYIVGPKDYPKFTVQKNNRTVLRNEIVRTAEGFLGVPYRWGGVSPEGGFDCSGLSMAIYHLNGLNLPRSSREQWAAGSPVHQNQLAKADLVFFATSRGKRISHVGVYIGADRFIHAPGVGKRIRVDSLSSGYFRRRYVGARTYL